MRLCSLDGSGPEAACGGKAAALRALARAGLPVPPGFAVPSEGFILATAGGLPAPAEPEAISAVGHVLDELARKVEGFDPQALGAASDDVVARARDTAAGGTLAVRSSMSLEDRSDAAAPGVFASQLDVAPGDVWAAIRAVWASACTPLAAAYARRRSAPASAPLEVAVIVQRYLPGRRITVYTRQPGKPRGPDACVERGDELVALPRRADESSAPPFARGALALALRAEAALALEPTGADVELIEDCAGKLWVVQARAIVHPTFRAKLAPPPVVLSVLVADGRTWHADFAHNPDPLSPAQAGLVERVEQAAASPYELRVCAGYLYTTPRHGGAAPPPASIAQLDEQLAAIDVRAAAALGEPAEHDLAATLAAYTRLVRVWSYELSPLVKAVRRAAGDAPGEVGARPSAVEARLLACARGELTEHQLVEQLGELSAAWDVAAPTLAEAPERLTEAIARLRLRVKPAPAAPPQRTLAAIAADLAERDDLWFARAQARVRRALLALGARLGLGDDIFWIPLREALAISGGEPFDLDRARARASAARAAWQRAAAWKMPLVVGGPSAPSPPKWRGLGCGGVAIGRALHVPELWRLWDHPLLETSTGATVIVTPAVTPALAVAAAGAAAIVSETGGLLDHGAAMARELGIPCVVGCTDAMSLPPRALVEIDGDSGVVRLLDDEPVDTR